MQIAAVMAARFRPNEPNGASSSVASPVVAITGEIGAVTPAARCAATPGRFCDAIVTMNSGSPRPIAAATLNSGITNTGRAQPHCTPASEMPPRAAARAMPATSTPGTAKRGQKRRPSTKTSAITPTSSASPCAASAASRPKRVSTPASSAAAIAMGTRSISRSNRPDAPASVISTAETMNAPVATGSDHAVRGGEQRRARRRPRGEHRLAVPQRQADAGEAGAHAQRPHPGRDLLRRGAEALRGLEHDRHRAREADQHRDEAGDDGRERDIFQHGAKRTRPSRARLSVGQTAAAVSVEHG